MDRPAAVAPGRVDAGVSHAPDRGIGHRPVAGGVGRVDTGPGAVANAHVSHCPVAVAPGRVDAGRVVGDRQVADRGRDPGRDPEWAIGEIGAPVQRRTRPANGDVLGERGTLVVSPWSERDRRRVVGNFERTRERVHVTRAVRGIDRDVFEPPRQHSQVRGVEDRTWRVNGCAGRVAVQLCYERRVLG